MAVERTEKDYTIEFGEYLAIAAENYANVMCGPDPHFDDVADALKAVRTAIFEYRKRAAKVRVPTSTPI